MVLSYSHSGWLPSLPRAHALTNPAIVSVTGPTGAPSINDTARKLNNVTFAINITNAPAISGFLVYATYNRTVLSPQKIDATGNVITGSTQIVNNCIDDKGNCSGYDSDGVVSYGLQPLGTATSPNPTNGLLFHVKFNIIGTGLGQVHLLLAQYVPTGANQSVIASTIDGYYTNVACPSSSISPCQPPSVSIQVTPPQPSIGSTPTFNATVIERNAGGKITFYNWLWDFTNEVNQQNQTDLTKTIQHTFQLSNFGGGCVFSKLCLTELTVHDTYGVVWVTTAVVVLRQILVDVNIANAALTTGGNPLGSVVYPNTQIHIAATIRNQGTVPETATVTISSDAGVLNTSNIGVGIPGFLNSSTIVNTVWNTTGLTPRFYSITVTITNLVTPGCATGGQCLRGNVNQTYVAQNDPGSTLSLTVWVLLTQRQVLGAFSLNLLQTVGLGLLVLFGLGFGVARFAKKPSYETEL